jgi:beta-lactamase regulating signal transducer with metallopeptidase domain
MNQQVSSLTTPKKNLRSTLILFIFIVISIFLFMLIAAIINQVKGPFVSRMNKYNTAGIWGMAVLSFLCLINARKTFTKTISAAKNSLNPLNDKLNQHRSALVRYLVICEVPVSINIILYMLTGNFVFQVYAGIFLGFMLAMAPVRRRVIAELELDGKQQKELE